MAKEKDDRAPAGVPPARFFNDISIEFLIHELKDPISVIETGLRAILEKQDKFGPLTDRQANTLARSLRCTRRAWGILNSLLEIGRSEAGCLPCVRFSALESVRQALKDALETVTGPAPAEIGRYRVAEELARLLAEHGIFLEVSADAAAAEMFQDETKFRQVAGNLFKNALHHRKQRMEVRVAVNGESLTLTVRDDGPGIDPDHHDLIFKRYTQLSECTLIERRGHGLGLAGALILARSLGGDIRVDSRKGEGAAFCLTLPLRLTPV
jgi:signal transduction histidine kinase